MGSLGRARRCRRAQGFEQHLRRPGGILDRVGRSQLGDVLAQQPVVDDRVREARRHAQIVFEHHPPTGAVAHEVGAADVRPDHVAREAARRAETGGTIEGLHTDDAVGDDRLLGVDVAKECVQRARPLSQAFGQLPPFLRGHHARHQVDREQLRAALTGDAEGDVVGALLLLDARFPGPQLGHAEPGNGVQDRPIVPPCPAVGIDRFVVAVFEVAAGQDGHRFDAGMVAEQQGGVVADDGRAGLPAAGGLGDQLIDHVGKTPPPAQRAPLPSRRRAHDQRLTAQLAYGLPITGLLQLRTQRGNQPADYLCCRAADGAAHVDQLALQPRPGGSPQRGSSHRRGQDRRCDACLCGLGLALDQSPEYPGDQQHGVHNGQLSHSRSSNVGAALAGRTSK